MKAAAVAMLCLAGLAACESGQRDGSNSTYLTNAAIFSALKPGMTEQQVVQVSHNRLPDRVIMQTCGLETPTPFPCKAYIYDLGLRAGAKLTVIFESVGGKWVVSQWF